MVRVPKLAADATGVRPTVVLLVAAVGFLLAALVTGRTGLAWGSVVLSLVAAARVLRRWRRSWLQRQDAPEDEIAPLDEEPMAGAEVGDAQLAPASVAAAHDADLLSGSAEQDAHPGRGHLDGGQAGEGPSGEGQPVEEDTDAADLLVVYELTDEVLVVDEQPRYHLARCRWPDHERAEQLPVREARDLGFTPCGRCRPDRALVRKHRSAGATAAGT